MSNLATIPGLVNVHSHTFQRIIRGRTEHRTAAARDTFWTWREAMYRAANLLTPDDVYHVARMAFLEMAMSGITTVGEFHYLHHAPDGTPYEDRNLLALQVARAAKEIGLRLVLLRTAYARGGQPRFLTPDPEQFIRDTDDLRAGGLAVGIAPHSVRALPLEYIMKIASYARVHGLPCHMHVAEQPGEVEQCIAEHGVTPVRLLHEHGLLDDRFTAVHAIHVTDDEIDYLAEAKAHVCACPTSERNLGDGAVPADRYGQAGVGICLGSDSNTQIDLLEDARLLEYHLRMSKLERAILTTEQLFESATKQGAQALGIGVTGDYVTVNLDDLSIAGSGPEALAANIVFSLERTAIKDVVVNGKPIIRDGHHELEDEVIARFKTVCLTFV